ncbi:MAG TPA: hypothetical protein VK982_08655 [Bacteroidales bacterium]|nr:hypothetical protein [Bacteroidales bacterium]
MIILQKGRMPDGTVIQIEDWSEDYSFFEYGSTIGAYPISKMGYTRQFAPRKGEKVRMQYGFESSEEAERAFNGLVEGTKTLKDFELNLYDKRYKDCV